MKSRKLRIFKKKEWEDEQKIRDLINFCVLEFSVKCPDNGDKVWHLPHAIIVEQKIRDAVGYIPASVLQFEEGQVLNRFGK